MLTAKGSPAHAAGSHQPSCAAAESPAVRLSQWPERGGVTDRTSATPDGFVRVESEVERKRPSLPRFVVIPGSVLSGWGLSGTTMVDVEINGVAIGRRSLKAWPERDAWFFDLTDAQSKKLGVDRGDVVSVELCPADPSPPAEILRLLELHPSTRRAWSHLSPAQRRMRGEHVRSAKRAETRERRARAALDLKVKDSGCIHRGSVRRRVGEHRGSGIGSRVPRENPILVRQEKLKPAGPPGGTLG